MAKWFKQSLNISLSMMMVISLVGENKAFAADSSVADIMGEDLTATNDNDVQPTQETYTFTATRFVPATTGLINNTPVTLRPGTVLDMIVPATDYIAANGMSAQERESFAKLNLSTMFSGNHLIPMAVRASFGGKLEGQTVYVSSNDLSDFSMSFDTAPDQGEDADEIAQQIQENQSKRAQIRTHLLPGIEKAAPTKFSNVTDVSRSYSNSAAVSRLIRVATSDIYTVNHRGGRQLRYIRYERVGRGRHRHMRRQAYCYRAVKDALRSSGLVNRGFSGSGEAYDASQDLSHQGFINLMRDPRVGAQLARNPDAAPKGAIMVYRGGPHGHVEIKVGPPGQGKYASITVTSEPAYGMWQGKRRHLVAVMVKPGV